jgi:hypothetical protein
MSAYRWQSTGSQAYSSVGGATLAPPPERLCASKAAIRENLGPRALRELSVISNRERGAKVHGTLCGRHFFWCFWLF